MSLLLFNHHPEQIVVVTDTLIVSVADGTEIGHVCKARVIGPTTIIVGTGLNDLVTEWVEVARDRLRITDLQGLALAAPVALPIIAERHADDGYDGTTTLYHFGVDPETGEMRRDTFRSTDDFAQETVTGHGGFGFKPAVATDHGLRPTCPSSFDGQHWVDIAVALRDEQLARPASERVYIGGHIDFHKLTPAGITYWQGPDIPSSQDEPVTRR